MGGPPSDRARGGEMGQGVWQLSLIRSCLENHTSTQKRVWGGRGRGVKSQKKTRPSRQKTARKVLRIATVRGKSERELEGEEAASQNMSKRTSTNKGKK